MAQPEPMGAEGGAVDRRFTGDNQNGRGEDPEGDLWGCPVVPQSGDDSEPFEDELVRVLGAGMLMPDQARLSMLRQARGGAAVEGKDFDLGVDSDVDSDSQSPRNGHHIGGRRARGKAVVRRRRQIRVRWVHLAFTAMLGGLLGPAIMVLVLWGGGFQSSPPFVKGALRDTPSSAPTAGAAAGARPGATVAPPPRTSPALPVPSTPPASSTSPATSPSRASISRIVNVYGPENMPSVQVQVGDELVVHLAYPPRSGGKTWTAWTTTADFLRLSAQTSTTGPSGQHIFTFRVTEVGVGRMYFGLRRPGVPLEGDPVPMTIRSVP